MTAVEFLSEQIRLTNIEGLRIKLWDAIEKAKEMEKEQIINAALYGFRRDSDGDDWQGDNYNAEKYYNTTFKLK